MHYFGSFLQIAIFGKCFTLTLWRGNYKKKRALCFVFLKSLKAIRKPFIKVSCLWLFLFVSWPFAYKLGSVGETTERQNYSKTYLHMLVNYVHPCWNQELLKNIFPRHTLSVVHQICNVNICTFDCGKDADYLLAFFKVPLLVM